MNFFATKISMISDFIVGGKDCLEEFNVQNLSKTKGSFLQQVSIFQFFNNFRIVDIRKRKLMKCDLFEL